MALAVTGFFTLVVLYFGLEYVRQLGGFQQERTAIEAAALAADKDLSANGDQHV